ncbi:hypothetical protein T11_9103 [Trichinella zimbabwensis]|uniref:Uncharacterized protein n=1 Tax=Trichinella zimbabwensis TaxID=268475 RepID=A0A0V1GBK0_9BILA|nr:hypothetical protein T11_9103 [Trichinella zimbabwensis]
MGAWMICFASLGTVRHCFLLYQRALTLELYIFHYCDSLSVKYRFNGIGR